MNVPIDSMGINAGGGATVRIPGLGPVGPKRAVATAMIIDTEGNVSIVPTRDIGLGTPIDRPYSFSLFVNALVGFNGAMGRDFAGTALSASGTAGPVTVAYSLPLDDNPGAEKFFLEIGYAPKRTRAGAAFEIGMTQSKSLSEPIVYRNPFASVGGWWGDWLYDVLH